MKSSLKNLIGKSLICAFLATVYLFSAGQASAQTGTLQGQVIDKETNLPVKGAKVSLSGTNYRTLTNDAGRYVIEDIKVNVFNILVTRATYAKYQNNGFKIKEGINTLDIVLEVKTVDKTVTIIGGEVLYNIDDPDSKYRLGKEDIKELTAVDVKGLAELVPGVSANPDGLQIRGGRVYEAQYMVDGASAQDPLAGTGFGLDVASNAVEDLSVTTGGVDAEYGDGSSGLISATIREGGDKFFTSGSWQRDHVNGRWAGGWNTDLFKMAIGTPIPGTNKKLTLFTSLQVNLTDQYFGATANQLHSSLLPSNDSIWAPRYDNNWGHTLKLTYRIDDKTKIFITNVHSLAISQNTRLLQIIGNDAIVTPGYQYPFSLDLDNATTYTHRSNLTVLNLYKSFNDKWSVTASVSRLFTNLRADANGAPFRSGTVDRIYDAESIVKDPVVLYNPDDSVVYVNPGPGLINNGGISSVWHDHYAQEYTGKVKFIFAPDNKVHYFSFGWEHKEQEYQWIDVFKPWVGAPVRINDTLTTASSSIGSSNDVWKVNPATGGLFLQDNLSYKGISAIIGARFNYWAPGKFADDAVANPDAPVLQTTRDDYNRKSQKIAGRAWKARLLPKLRVSFPVTDNNVLYFNYGHNSRLPHPRFVYAGLDPVYQDRSFLSNLGNPDLDPEVTVSYELGLKSQINKDLAFTTSAFYNDKFDYIVSRTAIVKDQTGRFVEKTFFINQDYARIRGIEASITKRFGRSYKMILNGTYQIATGKSNSALESRQQIRQNGFVSTSKENYLAWDRPIDLKLLLIFTPDTNFLKGKEAEDSNTPLSGWRKAFKNLRASATITYRSGLRYTPYVETGVSSTGRPIWEPQEGAFFTELGSAWFNADMRISKDFRWSKNRRFVSVFVECRNVFNNKNAQIINPVTGRAYEVGDALPYEQRDPNYPHPQDSGLPPTNPARYMTPTQLMFGINYSF